MLSLSQTIHSKFSSLSLKIGEDIWIQRKQYLLSFHVAAELCWAHAILKLWTHAALFLFQTHACMHNYQYATHNMARFEWPPVVYIKRSFKQSDFAKQNFFMWLLNYNLPASSRYLKVMSVIDLGMMPLLNLLWLDIFHLSSGFILCSSRSI